MDKIKKLKSNNFSLVLSGGAALGFAHLGIIKFLEENNLVPNEIIGNSMGSLIGASYAMGYSYDEILSFIKEINYLKLFSYDLGKRGIVNTKKIENFFNKTFFPKIKINQTKIPLKIICTNLENGEKKVFSSNKDNLDLTKIILASIAVPTIFKPIEVTKNSFYGDGFLVSNFPIEEAKKTNLILGVDVMSKKNLQLNKKKQKYFFINKFKELFRQSNNSFKIMILNQTKDKIIHFKKQLILIEPELKNYYGTNFKQYREIITKGYNEAKLILKNNNKIIKNS